MNYFLDRGIRTITIVVVLIPFFMWWYVAMTNPYVPPSGCIPGDIECRVDALDAHQVP